MSNLPAFTRYIWHVLVDGDYLNDYLTWLPAEHQPMVAWLGWLISLVSNPISDLTITIAEVLRAYT